MLRFAGARPSLRGTVTTPRFAAKERHLASLAATPFRPAFWARGGMLQTLAGMATRTPAPPWRTEVLPTPDGDELRLQHADQPQPAAPRVLVLHGLEGDRHSPYARHTAALAAERGWHCTVLEFRSCGGVLNRARRTYHSGETTDLALVADRLLARGGGPLFVLGVSLGANVLLKWLGERGAEAPAGLLAAAAVSPPFDLEVCARQCDTHHRGAIARHFLRTLIPKAIAKERQFPGQYDIAAVRRCRTFRAFDELVTAPVHGFRDAQHYYRSQSCGQFLPAIARPTLLLAAADDPLLRPELLPHAVAAASPFLHAQFVPHGGHVAFVDGGAPWAPRRWAEAQALRFFALQLADAGG